MEKYLGKYRIESTRLKNHDYRSSDYYFITILTKNRENYFGKIVETQDLASPLQVEPTKMGAIANQYWLDIPNHFPFVELDEYVIMPNHIHGILYFNRPDSDYRLVRPNTFGPQSRNLGSVIRGFKAATKKYATLNNIHFSWQSLYHDSIIRSKSGLIAVRRYIKNNLINLIHSEGLLIKNPEKAHDYAPQQYDNLSRS